MSTIQSAPNVYDFGLDFNYAVWVPGTEIDMVNVPWNNDYRDIVRFDSRAALDSYIDGLESAGISINNLSYLKPSVPIRLDIPMNTAMRYNYLRAKNPIQPIPNDIARNYYYFITDISYIAPNTTEVTVQLDAWQTFGYDATFGNCYVERGHIGIANINAFNGYGRDYLTIPEGIDTGSEYQIATVKDQVIMRTGTGPDSYDIMAVSAVDLAADAGDVTNPILNTASGSNINGVASGADVYIWDNIVDFQNFLSAYSDKPWVTQGILAVYIIPPVTRYDNTFTYSNDAPTYGTKYNSGLPTNRTSHSMFTNWRESTEILDLIPERYRGLLKLFTYPYMVVELTTWSATPILLKPESWADDDATIQERASLVPGSQRVAFSVYRYNRNPDSPINVDGGDDGGEYLDLMSIITNFVTVPIINDMAISYLASNKNGIAFQHTSADWAQQRALRGNSISYDQSSSAIDLSRNLNRLNVAGSQSATANQNLAISQNTANNALFGMIGGGMSGVPAKGGVVAGVAGVAAGIASAIPNMLQGQANAGVSQELNNRQTALQNVISNTTNNAATKQQSYIRDTNKDLADWSAKGDYENTIAGINAKVNDSKMIQPSTSGQFGGDAFNLVNDASNVSLRWKMIDKASMTIIGEYWLRYGYAVHKFMQIPTSFMAMTKFTYWKLTETYIINATMPESFKQIIRGIFEKGVTVWASPNDIGQIDIADNEPLEGISF